MSGISGLSILVVLVTTLSLVTSQTTVPAPMVYFNKGTYIVNEGNTLMVEIIRAGGDEPIDVAVRALNTNSAIETDDFSELPQYVTVAPGETGMLNIPVIADEATEGLETFDIMIVVSDAMEYRLGNLRLGKATVIIADTSIDAGPTAPFVYFNKGTYIVNEGDTLMVEIIRSGGDESINVAVRALNTNSAIETYDFSELPQYVTVAPGETGKLNIPVIADEATEGLETFDIMIVVSDAMEYRLGNLRLGRATVVVADTSMKPSSTKMRKRRN